MNTSNKCWRTFKYDYYDLWNNDLAIKLIIQTMDIIVVFTFHYKYKGFNFFWREVNITGFFFHLLHVCYSVPVRLNCIREKRNHCKNWTVLDFFLFRRTEIALFPRLQTAKFFWLLSTQPEGWPWKRIMRFRLSQISFFWIGYSCHQD